MEEGLLVNDLRDRIMNDVDDLEVVVLLTQPSVYPEGLDTDDLFLLSPMDPETSMM